MLLIPPAALVLWYVHVRTSNGAAIRQLEHEARRRGEPLTLAELQARYPPIPDGENAAVVLMELWAAEEPLFWQAYINDKRPLPERAAARYDPALPYLGSTANRLPRVGPLDSNSLAAAESYLSAKTAHLEQVRAALRRPRFRFPVRIEDGPYALLPHLSSLKTEAQNFRIVALVAAARGDKAAAIAAVKDAARTGQILAAEPLLISQLVRIACLSLALDGVEQLLSRQQLAVGELEALRRLVEEMNLQGVARSTLVNERPFCLCVFDPDALARAETENAPDDQPDDSGNAARNVRAGLRVMSTVGLLEPDRRLMLETLRDSIALAEEETPQSLREIDELFEEVQIKARKFPPRILSALMLASLQKVPSRFAAFEARRRAGLTAIAVEQHRLAHAGGIPERLDDLVPAHLAAVPPDPFDGQPLRFQKRERGFVVYSVGGDREDNGGKESVRGSAQHTDITFAVER